MVRSIAGALMAEFGFDVSEAAMGEEALIQCSHALPDLILVDWNMPGMDGIAFIQHLRTLPGGHAPRVLLMSTETRLHEVRAALRVGADSYLMKPFDRTKIAHRLYRLGLLPCQRSDATRQARV